MGRLLADFRKFVRERGLSGSAFLVGGSVRSVLSGEKNPKDIDIALRGNALKAARRFAEEAGATFVLLDERFGTARVVKGEEHLDISKLRGKSIEEDLSQRDITINAMALPLTSRRLIDPLGGAGDLMSGLVRVISEENLARDPLRILRCYRFSAAGGFRMERNSALLLKKLAPLLKRPAPERITEELKNILASQGAVRALERMQKDGVLRVIMPGFRGKNLQALKALWRAWGRFPFWREFHFYLFEAPGTRTSLGLAVLGAGTAGRALERLALSKKERGLIGRAYAFHARLRRLSKKIAGKAARIRVLTDAGDEIYAHLLFSHAFSVLEGEEEAERFLEFSRQLLVFYMKAVKPKLAQRPITGDDLKEEFGLSPSPLFKTVLEEIRMKWFMGEVRNRKEALEAAKRIIKGKT